jgi:REP element-mobilizing transposase RayT/uncharacterized protein YlbG (UPF0298 family)
VKITQTIRDIAIADKLNVIEYNICGDHMHILLVCEKEELPKIVGKLKSVSAKERNRKRGYTIGTAVAGVATEAAETAAETTIASIASIATRGHAPLSDTGKDARPDTRGTTQRQVWTQKFGKSEIKDEEYLRNAIEYIRNNRKKHELPEAKEIEKLKKEFVCSPEYAFRKEYNGGFDVVIGNPPYVQLQSMGAMSDILSDCGYETFHKGADLYCLFTEKGYYLLKHGGMQSFIMPNKWMLVAYGKPLRQFLSKTGLRQILNFGDIQFFQEATTYVCIFVIQKASMNENVQVLSLNRKTYFGDFITEVSANIYDYPASKFGESEWSIQPNHDSVQLEKMKKNGVELKELPVSIYRGILTGYNDAFYIDEEKRQELIKADSKSEELIKPMVRGRDITAYGITGFEYLIGTFPSLKLDIENYQAIKQHLLSFGYDRLKQTGDKGSRKKTNGEWFEIQDSIAYHAEFSKPKIIYPNMTAVFPFMYDESGILGNDKSFIISADNNSVSLPFLTAIFNSTPAKLWIWYNCPELQGGTREIRKVYFEHFPVPKANTEETEKLASLALTRSELTASLQALTSKFKRTIQREFNIEKLSVKLENWFDTPFNDFLKELVRNNIKLTLEQKSDWEEYFTKQQKEPKSIISEIEKTDKEIDKMVYELYGLTEEEIK